MKENRQEMKKMVETLTKVFEEKEQLAVENNELQNKLVILMKQNIEKLGNLNVQNFY
jgi:ABC-type enterochelin transport system substrate-binding protein